MSNYVRKVFEGLTLKGKTGESDWLANVQPTDRFYGFENFGNTCYANSVIQALFYCRPFRDCVLMYSSPHSTAKIVAFELGLDLSQFVLQQRPLDGKNIADQQNGMQQQQQPRYRGGELDAPLESKSSSSESNTNNPSISLKKEIDPWAGTLIDSILANFPPNDQLNDTLFSALQTLFLTIMSQRKQVGIHGPKQFLTKLKTENEIFASTQQQDAHEMFNYLINEVADTLLKQKKDILEKFKMHGLDHVPSKAENPGFRTWIHELFEGQLTNETKCLNCESITNRDEPFLDLSVDIEQNTSLSTCLRHFSTSEVLNHKNKFFCDTCNSLQEAEKKMKIKKLPNVLAVHLKRFKFQEQLGRFSKLSYRVCFTEKLGLFNTSDEAENSERIYDLSSIIVHIGSGPHHGHYVAVVKTHNQWLLMDDEEVTPLDDNALIQYFGEANLGTGYFFLYTASDYSSETTLKSMMPDGWKPPVHHAAESSKSASPPILASSEIGEEEDLNNPITPGLTLADPNLQNNNFSTNAPPGTIPSTSPRLKHRAAPTMSGAPFSNGKPGGVEGFHIDTKRPSLPSIAHVTALLSPGPMTSLPSNYHDSSSSSSSSNNAQNSRDPQSAMPLGEQKDSTWGWFRKNQQQQQLDTRKVIDTRLRAKLGISSDAANSKSRIHSLESRLLTPTGPTLPLPSSTTATASSFLSIPMNNSSSRVRNQIQSVQGQNFNYISAISNVLTNKKQSRSVNKAITEKVGFELLLAARDDEANSIDLKVSMPSSPVVLERQPRAKISTANGWKSSLSSLRPPFEDFLPHIEQDDPLKQLEPLQLGILDDVEKEALMVLPSKDLNLDKAGKILREWTRAIDLE